MGNRLCSGALRRRPPPVERRLTQPRRLVRQLSNVDYEKLRKLISAGKLAPCFDAFEDPDLDDLEQCPICFFYYPSLNRSHCCSKGICTECFLQMKPTGASRIIQCPFCKCSCYGIEYHGARTKEEKQLELAEEQKVIEAKIRMKAKSQNEERLKPTEQSRHVWDVQPPLRTNGDPSAVYGGPIDGNESSEIADQDAYIGGENIVADCSSTREICNTRHEGIEANLEEMMLMEATWQSFQRDKSEQISELDKKFELEDGKKAAQTLYQLLASTD